MPPHRARTVARVLDADAPFTAWTARHREEIALTALVRKNLPRSIGERIHVSDTADGVLELTAGSGAIATALRQRATEVRTALARDGRHFINIRVRVRPAELPRAERRAPERRLDINAAAPLFALAERLPGGPLKDALRRFSRRARGR